MQSILLAEREVDSFYIEFLLSTAKPDVVDALTQATILRFREQGLQTAVLTEAVSEGWLISCIAIQLESAES